MDTNLFIDLRELKLSGDVLEIGRDDNYIIYNYLKDQNQEISVELAEDENEIIENSKEKYDNIVLFFFLSTLKSSRERKKLLKEIKEYIKPQGEVYIFDIEKKSLLPYKSNFKIVFSEDNHKDLFIVETNPLLISNLAASEELIKEEFIIKESKAYEGYYFLKGERK